MYLRCVYIRHRYYSCTTCTMYSLQSIYWMLAVVGENKPRRAATPFGGGGVDGGAITIGGSCWPPTLTSSTSDNGVLSFSLPLSLSTLLIFLLLPRLLPWLLPRLQASSQGLVHDKIQVQMHRTHNNTVQNKSANKTAAASNTTGTTPKSIPNHVSAVAANQRPWSCTAVMLCTSVRRSKI